MGRAHLMLVLAACSNLASAAPQEPQRFSELDALLSARADARRFAGVVAVARDGKLLHAAALGQASIEFEVPHTAATRFKLHSLSKPLLATFLLRSVDAERVELNGLVGEYLPGWPMPWGEVTVRQLVTHTSGVPDFAESFLEQWSGSARSTWEELAPRFAAREPGFEPGTGWAYSNAGYVLLSALLENVWDQPLEAVFATQLTTPLALESTALERTPPWSSISYDGARVLAGLAAGYNGSPQALQVAHSKMYAIPGAGGIVSNAGDLIDFAHALFEGELLSAQGRAELTTVTPGQSVPYALGWFVREREGQTVYVHDGGNNGFVTSLEYYPELRVAIVILCNLGYLQLGELRDEIARLALGALG